MIQTTDLDEQKRLARSLAESYLLIQGPPGTGKTWTGARLIVDLLGHGCRVGVTALSHHAINNLLAAVELAAREAGLTFRGIRHVTNEEVELRDPDQIENGSGSADDHGYQLFGATTWSFAGSKATGQFDYLVIDEAGQMSLADALAAGTAARNLILLGDPLQLPQVSQATHPEGTNASVLEHLLGDEATVPPDRGIFLDTTRRLHPDLNRFISDQVYEGRLKAYETCACQSTGLGTGLRAVAVAHAGDSVQSRAEAEAIRFEITRLLGTSLTEADGRTRALARGGHHGRRSLQRAGETPPEKPPARRARRHGRPVPGTGGGRRLLLDDVVVGRGHAARHRLRLQPQPPERGDLACAVPRLPRLLAAR